MNLLDYPRFIPVDNTMIITLFKLLKHGSNAHAINMYDCSYAS